MVGLNEIVNNAETYYKNLWNTRCGCGEKESYFAIAKKVVWNSWTVSRLNFVDVTLKSLIALPYSLTNFVYDGVYGGVFGYALGNELAKERFSSSYSGLKENVVILAKGVSGVVWPQLEVWFANWHISITASHHHHHHRTTEEITVSIVTS